MQARKLGIFSAILASICCLGPLILVLIGLGSLGMGAAIGRYHWFFIGGGLGLVSFAWRSYSKGKKTCNLKGCKMEKKRMTLISLIIASLVVTIFVGLNIYTYVVQGAELEKEEESQSIGSISVVIPVKGMTCFTCEIAVSSALKRVDGMATVKASVKEGNVRINYDPHKTNVNQLIDAINKTGYKAELPGGG